MKTINKKRDELEYAISHDPFALLLAAEFRVLPRTIARNAVDMLMAGAVKNGKPKYTVAEKSHV